MVVFLAVGGNGAGNHTARAREWPTATSEESSPDKASVGSRAMRKDRDLDRKIGTVIRVDGRRGQGARRTRRSWEMVVRSLTETEKSERARCPGVRGAGADSASDNSLRHR